jgi:hypothetical protein
MKRKLPAAPSITTAGTTTPTGSAMLFRSALGALEVRPLFHCELDVPSAVVGPPVVTETTGGLYV